MNWQRIQEWIIKYAIVGMVGILSSNMVLAAQKLTWGQEKLIENARSGWGIFSPDGNLLVVKTITGVLLLETGSLRVIQRLPTQGLSVSKLAFSPDSRYLAWNYGGHGSYPSVAGVVVWDLTSFTQVAHFVTHQSIDSIAGLLLFVPGGELLVAGSSGLTGVIGYESRLTFWKVGTWEKHGIWGGLVDGFAFTHDGKQFVARGDLFSRDGPVYRQSVVDVQTLKAADEHGGFLWFLDPEEIRNLERCPIAYSPDGRFKAVKVHWDLPSENHDLVICDSQNDNLIANLSETAETHDLRFHSISPDSKWLATVREDKPKQVILWNTQTWEIDHRLNLPDGQIIAEGFAKGSYWCADLTLTGELRLWDLIKGELLASSRDPVADVEPVGLKHISWGVLKSSELLPNYPNPANPETWIPFVLHKTADVEIRVYDVAGNLVRTLQLGINSPGVYFRKEQAAYWDGKNGAGEIAGSGIYFYQMRVGNEAFVRKAMLLK